MQNRERYKSILAAALITAAFYIGLKALISPGAARADDSYYSVTRVIDGDTIVLSSGQRVRLIGIDTPEMHYSNKLLRDVRRSHLQIKAIQQTGARAAAFTRELCLGKKVRLEFDLQRKDKYNRLLAYVYLEDSTFVNGRILQEGYGRLMTIPPNVKYADYFVKMQKEARENRKGLWKE